MSKPKFAMYWAASCGGCEIAVLNIHEKILDVDAAFDVVFWPVAMDAKYAALAVPAAGRWVTAAEWGAREPLPIDLLANVLDRETALAGAGWIAAPLAPRTEEGEVLVVRLLPSPPAPLPKGEGRNEGALPKGEGRNERALAVIGQLVPVLHQAISAVRRRARLDRKLRRLEAILEIASQWNQTRELEPLLLQMAEAAARLLGADLVTSPTPP